MPLLYAMVARRRTVLTEYTNTRGNFPTIALELLARTGQHDHRKSVTQDVYVFHYVVSEGITYLCLSDDDLHKQRVAFGFLAELQSQFDSLYGQRAQTAIAFSMSDFTGHIQRLMVRYNDPGAEAISQVQARIADVKDVMVQNIDQVLERGERLEVLVEKSDELNQSAFQFRASSRQLRSAMFWRKVKIYALIAFVAGLLILFLCMMICNPNFKKCKS